MTVSDSALAQIREKLTKLQVGGCSCQTKTHEVQYHDERCVYRLANEIEDLLLAARAAAPVGGDAVYQWRDVYGAWHDCGLGFHSACTDRDRRILYTAPPPAAAEVGNDRT